MGRIQSELERLHFQEPGHRFHGIDFLREINSVVELILGGGGGIEIKVSILSSSLGIYEYRYHIEGRVKWMKRQFQLYYILWDLADSIPYLIPRMDFTQFADPLSPSGGQISTKHLKTSIRPFFATCRLPRYPEFAKNLRSFDGFDQMSAFWSMFWFKPFRNFLQKIVIFRTFDHWSEIL